MEISPLSGWAVRQVCGLSETTGGLGTPLGQVHGFLRSVIRLLKITGCVSLNQCLKINVF